MRKTIWWKIYYYYYFIIRDQLSRRKCNAEATAGDDDECGEDVGVDVDEGERGRYLMSEKKKGQDPSQLSKEIERKIEK